VRRKTTSLHLSQARALLFPEGFLGGDTALESDFTHVFDFRVGAGVSPLFIMFLERSDLIYVELQMWR